MWVMLVMVLSSGAAVDVGLMTLRECNAIRATFEMRPAPPKHPAYVVDALCKLQPE